MAWSNLSAHSLANASRPRECWALAIPCTSSFGLHVLSHTSVHIFTILCHSCQEEKDWISRCWWCVCFFRLCPAAQSPDRQCLPGPTSHGHINIRVLDDVGSTSWETMQAPPCLVLSVFARCRVPTIIGAHKRFEQTPVKRQVLHVEQAVSPAWGAYLRPSPTQFCFCCCLSTNVQH